MIHSLSLFWSHLRFICLFNRRKGGSVPIKQFPLHTLWDHSFWGAGGLDRQVVTVIRERQNLIAMSWPASNNHKYKSDYLTQTENSPKRSRRNSIDQSSSLRTFDHFGLFGSVQIPHDFLRFNNRKENQQPFIDSITFYPTMKGSPHFSLPIQKAHGLPWTRSEYVRLPTPPTSNQLSSAACHVHFRLL